MEILYSQKEIFIYTPEKPSIEDDTMSKKVSSSSKQSITNSQGTAVFPCPSCGETEIVRTKHERAIVAKYTCDKCGFTGPN